MKLTQPIYAHDCDLCVYLGKILWNNKWIDFYVHPAFIDKNEKKYFDGLFTHLIHRTSSEPSNYGCMPLKYSIGSLSPLANIAFALFLDHYEFNRAHPPTYYLSEKQQVTIDLNLT